MNLSTSVEQIYTLFPGFTFHYIPEYAWLIQMTDVPEFIDKETANLCLDAYSPVNTKMIGPDFTRNILIDNTKNQSGSTYDDWDIRHSKRIQGPDAKRQQALVKTCTSTRRSVMSLLWEVEGKDAGGKFWNIADTRGKVLVIVKV